MGSGIAGRRVDTNPYVTPLSCVRRLRAWVAALAVLATRKAEGWEPRSPYIPG
jgi:hypothetical protein